MFNIQILFISSLVLILSSCTNNLNSTQVQNTTASALAASNPIIGTNQNSFTLSQVLPTQSSPNQSIDLIGDGTGTLGSICPVSSSSSSTTTTNSSASDTTNGSLTNSSNGTGASCSCTYTYTTTSGANEQISVSPTYSEANLLRCPISGIPQGVTTIGVSITTIANTFSNVVNFNLSTTGNNLDTTAPSSFLIANRYQCRDIVDIPYLLDGSIIDPILSVNPHISYNLNFYSTYLADTLSKFASSQQERWSCPPILTPQSYLSTSPTDLAKFDLNNFYNVNNINLKIYSKAAPSGSGSKLIYPPQPGSFNRSTFYLAKQATGAFTVSLNAYFAPNLLTQTGSQTYPPIGYGASPVITGTNQESCPDVSTVPIPSTYHWVKIWLFRASLPARTYQTSSSITSLASITCYPGTWTDSNGNPSPVFNTCDLNNSISVSASTTGPSIYTNGVYNNMLADRFLGTGQCLGFSAAGSVVSPFTCPGGIGPGCLGADQWITRAPFSAGGICPSNSPMGTCDNNQGGQTVLPRSSTVSTGAVDSGPSRYDFLFVVSPTSLMYADMLAGDTNALIYTPYRFPIQSDCLSNDPDIPTGAGDCNPALAISNYGLVTHDVGANDDPSVPRIFPICAIQPN